jgi:hypothetical protein
MIPGPLLAIIETFHGSLFDALLSIIITLKIQKNLINFVWLNLQAMSA